MHRSQLLRTVGAITATTGAPSRSIVSYSGVRRQLVVATGATLAVAPARMVEPGWCALSRKTDATVAEAVAAERASRRPRVPGKAHDKRAGGVPSPASSPVEDAVIPAEVVSAIQAAVATADMSKVAAALHSVAEKVRSTKRPAVARSVLLALNKASVQALRAWALAHPKPGNAALGDLAAVAAQAGEQQLAAELHEELISAQYTEHIRHMLGFTPAKEGLALVNSLWESGLPVAQVQDVVPVAAIAVGIAACDEADPDTALRMLGDFTRRMGASAVQHPRVIQWLIRVVGMHSIGVKGLEEALGLVVSVPQVGRDLSVAYDAIIQGGIWQCNSKLVTHCVDTVASKGYKLPVTTLQRLSRARHQSRYVHMSKRHLPPAAYFLRAEYPKVLVTDVPPVMKMQAGDWIGLMKAAIAIAEAPESDREFISVMRAHVEAEDVKGTFRTFEQMQEGGVELPAEAFELLVQVCRHTNHVNRANTVYRFMTERQGPIRPQLMHMLIDLNAANGNWQQVLEYTAAADKRGLVLEPLAYCHTLSALVATERIESAREYIAEVQARGLLSWTDKVLEGQISIDGLDKRATGLVILDSLFTIRRNAGQAPQSLKIYCHAKQRPKVRGFLRSLTPSITPEAMMDGKKPYMLVKHEDLIAWLTAPQAGDEDFLAGDDASDHEDGPSKPSDQ